MNERIRSLYYECQDESQSTEECYQKFAELIIEECARRAEVYSYMSQNFNALAEELRSMKE